MKLKLAAIASNRTFPWEGRLRHPVRAYLLVAGVASIDALDVALRALSVATVATLSLAGYGHSSQRPLADPALIVLGLVIYNLLVVSVGGVPWRRAPGYSLFLID